MATHRTVKVALSGEDLWAALVFTGLLSTLPIASAFADTAGSASQPFTPGFGILGFLIAYSSRRRPIGGWLLYFYMQLYLSLLITLVLTIPYIEYLSPSKWARTDLYVWYLLSVIPCLIAQGTEVVFGTLMINRRTEMNVRRLRTTILALMISTVISLLIDLKFFNEGADGTAAVTMDILTIFFSAIWLAYFYKSVRVQRVFISHNWTYADELPPASKTPRERSYLLKRAAVWGGVFYVSGFALTGISQADTKPDASMLFGLPLVYALLAVLISYVCPISRKKRELLGAMETPRVSPTV